VTYNSYTDPSAGPGSSEQSLPGAYRDDVERNLRVLAVFGLKRLTDSTHYVRQVTAAVSVQVRRFLQRPEMPNLGLKTLFLINLGAKLKF